MNCYYVSFNRNKVTGTIDLKDDFVPGESMEQVWEDTLAQNPDINPSAISVKPNGTWDEYLDRIEVEDE